MLKQEEERPPTMPHKTLEAMKGSVYRSVSKRDLLLFYPYHSFNYLINFLYEAGHDPFCTDIMIALRSVKSENELACMRAAARITHETFDYVLAEEEEHYIFNMNEDKVSDDIAMVASVWGKLTRFWKFAKGLKPALIWVFRLLSLLVAVTSGVAVQAVIWKEQERTRSVCLLQ